MNYLAPLGRVFGNLKGLYSGINGATLTGAIDVVVVEQEDGSFKCSPFHVRFGKLGVLRSREKVVDIEVNGVVAPLRMKLGDSGEAFFVQEIDLYDELEDENLATSPLPSSPQLSDSDNRYKLPEVAALESELELKNGNDVAITIVDDEIPGAENAAVTSNVGMDLLVTTKMDDPKGRKRRRKRRKNQGSKSDIKMDISTSTPSKEHVEASETIFKMDEDLSVASDILRDLDLDICDTVSSTVQPNRSYHRDFYSDTEVDATSSPQNSRPSTPIQSDSEYEISKVQKEGEDEEVGKWPWGELPSTGATTPATTPMVSMVAPQITRNGNGNVEEQSIGSDDENSSVNRSNSESKSMLSGMFSFMKRNHTQGSGALGDATSGIYLDDLNLEDPEVAALYFPKFGKEVGDTSRKDHDEDGESGKGNSLPQSPAPGSSPKTSQMANYMEEHQWQHSDSNEPQFEALSVCGGSLGLFDQSQLTYDELVENPEILLNTSPESVVVKIDGKLVPWPAAFPQLLSTTFFKRPLPPHVYERLIGQYMKKDFSSNSSSSSPTNAGNAKDVGSKKGYSWFPWRRSHNSATQESSNEDNVVSSPESGASEKESNNNEINIRKGQGSLVKSNQNGGAVKEIAVSLTSSSDESEGGGGRDEKTGRASRVGNSSNPIPAAVASGNIEKFKKSLRLTSEQLSLLGLRYGQNEAVFSVTTAYQGTTTARCHIYLWRYDDRVVVSDIDGTITKSDVLGHILPIIGNDWAQSGVAQLFTQIQDNGYKMLYLSARAIGQASITRDYLRSIKQGDVTLPDGPLLLNPTSLMSAFHREVIEKKPEEFKIACLKDIQTLFPDNPFYAGYGNRINDVWSYRAVDINISRIFTINHKGELRHALTNTFQSSYTSLVELAEHIFPAYKSLMACSQTDGYNNFEFWRISIPLVPGKLEENNHTQQIQAIHNP